MKKIEFLSILITIFLSACGALRGEQAADSTNRMMGGGEGMNMMMMHHGTQIPDQYAGLTNPIPAEGESLARGAEIYNTNCSTCHGDGGMGDGPSASALNPSPPAIAHTSQMTGDDYLFWRITEGGIPFGTAMPAYKALEEGARWDVINYLRALGKGEMTPGRMMGGELYDPGAELAARAEMLAQAVEQGVITKAQANTFASVHLQLDEWLAAGSPGEMTGNADDIQADRLAKLVAAGMITQAQADTFSRVHDQLIKAGLMR